MKKLHLILIGIFLLVIVFFASQIIIGPRLFRDYERRSVKVGKTSYKLYISDSDQKRLQGLSNVKEMPRNQGMLFVFESPDTYGFWMKDMYFPLDLIYINNQQVVDLKENIGPDSFPQIFYPSTAADAVIELHSGEIKKSTVRIGDKIKVTK